MKEDLYQKEKNKNGSPIFHVKDLEEDPNQIFMQENQKKEIDKIISSKFDYLKGNV